MTSSSQSGTLRLVDMLLPYDTVYETLTSLWAPSLGVYTAPLGLRKSGRRLSILIYPGTRRLRTVAEEAIEACISLVSTPEPLLARLLGRQPPLHKPDIVHPPCPAPAQALIEAIVSSRVRRGDMLELTLEPLEAKTLTPTGYTRVHGAAVELAVAYTRVLHWAAERRCEKALPNLEEMERAYKIIERLDWNGAAKRLSRMLIEQARRALALAACPTGAHG